jgi:hypothetical protein
VSERFCDPWEDIPAPVEGLSADEFERCRVLMLRLYIDDTGRDGRSPWMHLAGWVGRVPEWMAFRDAWEEERKRKPLLPYFKRSEAERRDTEPWKSMTDDEITARILAFAALPSRHVVPLAVGVELAAFYATPAFTCSRPKEAPYYWLLILLMNTLSDLCKDAESDEPIAIVFDEPSSEKEKRRLARMIVTIMELRGAPGFESLNRIVSVGSADDKRVRPLQAADLLGWNISERRRDETAPTTEEFRTLLPQGLGGKFDYPTEELARQNREAGGVTRLPF